MKLSNSNVLNEILMEIISKVGVEISTDLERNIYLDLNTGMKSQAHLYINEDSCTLKGRYDTEVTIPFEEDWEGEFKYEFYSFIAYCKNRRDYAASGWWTILEKEGFDLSNY